MPVSLRYDEIVKGAAGPQTRAARHSGAWQFPYVARGLTRVQVRTVHVDYTLLSVLGGEALDPVLQPVVQGAIACVASGRGSGSVR